MRSSDDKLRWHHVYKCYVSRAIPLAEFFKHELELSPFTHFWICAPVKFHSSPCMQQWTRSWEDMAISPAKIGLTQIIPLHAHLWCGATFLSSFIQIHVAMKDEFRRHAKFCTNFKCQGPKLGQNLSNMNNMYLPSYTYGLAVQRFCQVSFKFIQQLRREFRQAKIGKRILHVNGHTLVKYFEYEFYPSMHY